MIITSIYHTNQPGPDGRYEVHETHTGDDGRVFREVWLNDGSFNAQFVLEERAIKINKVLAEREAARTLVTGTEVPYTKHEFISRFTAQEYASIEAIAVTDVHVKFFLLKLNASGGVYMSLARQGINYLQAIGILTASRAAIIGAD